MPNVHFTNVETFYDSPFNLLHLTTKFSSHFNLPLSKGNVMNTLFRL